MARLRFSVVDNFVPSSWIIPDAIAIEIAPNAQEILSKESKEIFKITVKIDDGALWSPVEPRSN